jgi:hypothetical protein
MKRPNRIRTNDPIAEEPSVMEEEPVIELKKQEPAVSPIDSLFSSEFFSKENVSNGLPFILFLTMLGMLYIANHHYAEKSVRNSEKIKKELKELYWEHLNISSNLMTQSKQTEVAKLTEVFGLKESVVPPTKLEVNE